MNTPEQIAEGHCEEPCPECDDSGIIERHSGGFWTGENMSFSHEFCGCLCGIDAIDQANGTGLHAVREVLMKEI